jgi:hypothetical protein
MLPVLFAIAPAMYVWSVAGPGKALAVAAISYGVFVFVAWRESRKIMPIDFAFSSFHNDLRKKRLLLQIFIPSLVGWPLAWFLIY